MITAMTVASLDNSLSKGRFTWREEEIIDTDFISTNKKELIKIFSEDEKRKVLILHTDITPITLLALLIGTFRAFISNSNSQGSFLDFLSVGDKVIYEKRLGEFMGKDSNGYFKVRTLDKRKTPITNFIPANLTYKLKPYFGDAQSLDGRGLKLKEDKKDVLLASLFGIPIDKISRDSNKSILIVCSREKADSYIKNLKLSTTSKTFQSINAIFPSAFYTTNDTYDYAGNSSKANPIIKFVNKLSVARELIISDKDIETLIVEGEAYILSDSMELDSLLNRSTLKTCLLVGELQKGDYRALKKNFPDLFYYAWTQMAIESNVNDFQKEHIHSSYINSRQYELLKRNFVQNINIIDVKNSMDSLLIRECKDKLMIMLKNATQELSLKDFIVRSFSLLNLFERSIFPISVMEEMITQGELNALSPNESLKYIDSISHNYNGSEKEIMQRITQILQIFKSNIWMNNPKFEQVKKKLFFDRESKQKKAVIVSKKYYRDIVSKALPTGLRSKWESYDILTPKKYDTSLDYEVVIFSGIFEGNILNPVELSNANRVDYLCYETDKSRLKEIELFNEKKIDFYNRLNHFIPENQRPTFSLKQTDKGSNEKSETPVVDVYSFEQELESLIDGFSLETYSSHSISQDPSQGVEISKIVSFESGEVAFLTRNYTTYIIDYSKKQVVEETIDSLEVEDTLLFSNYDKEIKDLIDSKMKELIEKEQGALLRSYQRSLYWKVVLKEYMKKNGLSYKDIAYKFKQAGCAKHEVTIRSWLDDKIYIVGPKDLESFEAIALITEDPAMNEDHQAFHEACRQIRSLRTRILKFIGLEVMRLYDSKLRDEDEELSALFLGNERQHIKALKVEKITNANDLYVAPHFINKPVHF
ncbi:DrmE family protein [Saccharibacillus qingshengii]|uniref:DrmE family protein n=1 Tax=Saccharibacillus qingshengii TaxID=1763540 RepID=UPI00155479EE|nr:DrmE family protein [Saccharibacillus qingshengii]